MKNHHAVASMGVLLRSPRRHTSNSTDYDAVSELHVADSTGAGFHYKGIRVVFQMKAED